MKILLSWLRDYIDIEVPPEKIAEGLNMAGIEVEGIHQPGRLTRKVVVGRILTREPHPNADKLTISTVDVGHGTTLSVVCGAPNNMPGYKVPVAMVGATLPSGFEISQAKIRGIESFGMLCSQKELGISEDHSGLMILPPEAPVGEDIVKFLGLDETVFEISITPNRGDALSHLGIARELSAIFNLPMHRNALENAVGEGDVHEVTSVTIENPDLCPRYGARVVRNVKVGESPKWLADRLRRVGIRPINNLVDITNYVMLAIGHPLHAFDFDLLEGNRIVVRRGKAGETITSLDGVVRKLDSTMLVIADARKPTAIAGVMGGADTGINDRTVNVLLEAAYFEPTCIRKTAKALGMMSESSYRFERGTNIDNIPIALNLAAKLLETTAGGKSVRGIIDQYPAPKPLRRIMLRARRVSKVLGMDLKPQQIETVLLRLKLEVSREDETLWIGVPPFRHDLEQEADLIEEVARLVGYGAIPQSLPHIPSILRLPTPLQTLEQKVRDHLISIGMNEIMSYSFIPRDAQRDLLEGEPVLLKNPLSEEQSQMRSSLLWGMFDALTRNILADEFDLRFFEIGKTFTRTSGRGLAEADKLCIGLCGSMNPNDWTQSKKEHDLNWVKGVIAGIFKLCGKTPEFAPGAHPAFRSSQQLEIRLKHQVVGIVGNIHPRFLTNKKMPESIFLLELDYGILSAQPVKIPRMKSIPEFPPVRRDLSLLMPAEVPYQDIRKILQDEGKEILESVRLFDVYVGKGIDPGKRSMAFSLTFRSPEKTLTEEEVKPAIDSMVRRIESELHGKLREK